MPMSNERCCCDDCWQHTNKQQHRSCQTIPAQSHPRGRPEPTVEGGRYFYAQGRHSSSWAGKLHTWQPWTKHNSCVLRNFLVTLWNFAFVTTHIKENFQILALLIKYSQSVMVITLWDCTEALYLNAPWMPTPAVWTCGTQPNNWLCPLGHFWVCGINPSVSLLTVLFLWETILSGVNGVPTTFVAWARWWILPLDI